MNDEYSGRAESDNSSELLPFPDDSFPDDSSSGHPTAKQPSQREIWAQRHSIGEFGMSVDFGTQLYEYTAFDQILLKKSMDTLRQTMADLENVRGQDINAIKDAVKKASDVHRDMVDELVSNVFKELYSLQKARDTQKVILPAMRNLSMQLVNKCYSTLFTAIKTEMGIQSTERETKNPNASPASLLAGLMNFKEKDNIVACCEKLGDEPGAQLYFFVEEILHMKNILDTGLNKIVQAFYDPFTLQERQYGTKEHMDFWRLRDDEGLRRMIVRFDALTWWVWGKPGTPFNQRRPLKGIYSKNTENFLINLGNDAQNICEYLNIIHQNGMTPCEDKICAERYQPSCSFARMRMPDTCIVERITRYTYILLRNIKEIQMHLLCAQAKINPFGNRWPIPDDPDANLIERQYLRKLDRALLQVLRNPFMCIVIENDTTGIIKDSLRVLQKIRQAICENPGLEEWSKTPQKPDKPRSGNADE